ncbi:hypothetical protein ACX0KM_19355 [Pseudomonas promysalinigenes]
MNASDLTSLFGVASDDERIIQLFEKLSTLRRPRQPDRANYEYYDWVLVRKLGLELGFVDEEYQAATERFRWGHGKLLLAQAYFYSGNDEIRKYSGNLPKGLRFSDTREQANTKLSKFESTRRSYLNDTWDLDDYRITVSYKANDQAIDKLVCRLIPAPIKQTIQATPPALEKIYNSFGQNINNREFRDLWPTSLADQDHEISENPTKLDLRESLGASLTFINSKTGLLFHSITLHRNRDQESQGWKGQLPLNLDFEDSPLTLFSKISAPPASQGNSNLTGHAVWHFNDYTLHVLYSNIDNRLIRVNLITPGIWKCVEDYEY